MPTITDTTVVAQAYDTSGNGGRKLVRLSNGWLVAGVYNSTNTRVELYISKDNGLTFPISITSGMSIVGSLTGLAIEAIGTFVYVAILQSNGAIVLVVYNMLTTTKVFNSVLDSNKSSGGGISLVSNSSGTELHACWASKNSTYPNSFNIRYAKGTINADGTVTWGAVEQVTSNNTTSYYNQNPSVIIGSNGYPIIISEADSSSNYQIHSHKFDGSTWSGKVIYNGGSYIQSSPSAIYVPQSINGLANGRIWVAWHGTDATDTAVNNIRVSYSDDGGVTWSTMNKLSSGNLNNMTHASITANKLNEIFVVYTNNAGLALNRSKYSNGTWSNLVSLLPNNTPKFPSTLFDNSFSVNFTEPLLIYQGTTGSLKVGFYGTWTVTTISVTPGNIGQRTDKNNILSYSITTDGEMSDVVEKINGQTITTKALANGEETTVSLTQAQWGAIKFGKYADATGGKNTLTVEMGTDKWTYTFDKRLATDADIVSASKAVKDTNEVYLPSVKKQLADAITGKGQTASGSDTFAQLATAIGNINAGKKWASGTTTSSSTTLNFSLYTGTENMNASYYISVTGLTFKPSMIIAFSTTDSRDKVTVVLPESFASDDTIYRISVKNTNGRYGVTGNASITDTSFLIPTGNTVSIPVKWIAIE